MKSLVIAVLSLVFSIGGFTQTPKSKVVSPRSASNSQSKEKVDPIPLAEETRDEKVEWERVLAVVEADQKALAVRKFLESFPESQYKAQGKDLIVRLEAESGFEQLRSGDVENAVRKFTSASREAVSPVPDQLFSEVLSKLPANLYFRGAREDGIRIADILEEKIQGNAAQLLVLASFYLAIENGSKARSLAETAVKITPDSSAAYMTLGLAYRMDFRFEDSAAAYERALALDPNSILARRGLAEMKRSLGKPDEAALLFSEILAKEPTDSPARSGLILSMLEAGKRTDAESEMRRSLEANPGNVILLAGASYWYASQGDGEKAIDYAKKAVDLDPRYIWSHIALARGYLALNKPLDAEKTLLAARKYGNFPTLDYEIASARFAAGFFRDAAEELAKSFLIKDGLVQTNLGGRITRSSRNFAELVGNERRASIFAAAGPDTSQADAKLFSLLELKQALDASKPDKEKLNHTVDQFVQGEDAMRLHRRLFVSAALLDKNLELKRAAEIAQAAIDDVDAALNSPDASSATLASELYENRRIALARGEYLNVPDLPRSTLSAIVRGRIEEINGWAKYLLNDPEAAVVRLKRAVSVLPPKSAWWQSASWRLGSALALSGKNEEALETYVRTYKSSETADRFRYQSIAALYRKVHGNISDLKSLIGPEPDGAADVTLGKPSTNGNDAGEKTMPEAVQNPRPGENRTDPLGSGTETSPTSKPDTQSKGVVLPAPGPVPDPSKETLADKLPSTSDPPHDRNSISSTSPNKKAEIFPPVVISIPAPTTTKRSNNAIPYLPNPNPRSSGTEHDDAQAKGSAVPVDAGAGKPAPQPETSAVDGLTSTSPCTINASDESLTLVSGGGGRAVIVGIDDETNVDSMKAISSSPENVGVRREPISGIVTRALFVITSETGKVGIFQVTFELPCGKKAIVVRVR